MSDSFETPWMIAHQVPLSMGFPRPFPSPGDLPSPGIKPMSPALAGRFFTTGAPGKPHGTLPSNGFSNGRFLMAENDDLMMTWNEKSRREMFWACGAHYGNVEEKDWVDCVWGLRVFLNFFLIQTLKWCIDYEYLRLLIPISELYSKMLIWTSIQTSFSLEWLFSFSLYLSGSNFTFKT